MSKTKTISEADAKQMKRDQAAAARGVKMWRFTDWPRTPEQACDYVNSDPRQGAGEAVFVMLPNIRVGVFYYS